VKIPLHLVLLHTEVAVEEIILPTLVSLEDLAVEVVMPNLGNLDLQHLVAQGLRDKETLAAAAPRSSTLVVVAVLAVLVLREHRHLLGAWVVLEQLSLLEILVFHQVMEHLDLLPVDG